MRSGRQAFPFLHQVTELCGMGPVSGEHFVISLWLAISSGESCLDRRDICAGEQQGLHGNQNPGDGFPGKLLSSFLITQDLAQ